MNHKTLCLHWLLILATTSLASFALGMLLVVLEFQVGDYLKSVSPGLWVPIVFGVGAYLMWLRWLITLTWKR